MENYLPVKLLTWCSHTDTKHSVPKKNIPWIFNLFFIKSLYYL